MEQRPPTIFCDIDGTLVKHQGYPAIEKIPNSSHKMELLPGTLKKLWEWDSKGYRIILTTGRKEGLRKSTEKQLAVVGIIYDQLIMGIGGGKRYLVNDRKPHNSEDYAHALNLDRNIGIENLEI